MREANSVEQDGVLALRLIRASNRKRKFARRFRAADEILQDEDLKPLFALAFENEFGSEIVQVLKSSKEVGEGEDPEQPCLNIINTVLDRQDEIIAFAEKFLELIKKLSV